MFCILSCWIAIATGCSSEPPPALPNLILIVIDTLRADHLGCYGYEHDTSPNIDKFADSGVLFQNAYCQMPTTGPSHASIFTSKHPRSHGVLKNGWVLSDTFPTIAQILKENGYTTAAVVSSFALASKFGFSKGFDFYDEKLTLEGSTMSILEQWEGHAMTGGFDQRADLATQKAVRWIQQNDKKPFFLWVHYFDPHSPYAPPEPYEKKFIKNADNGTDRIIAKYDGEIKFVDEEVGKLLNVIKKKRLDPNTLIIIISDHGEGLGQHNWLAHGMFLYDEQMRIALMMSFPNVIPRGIEIDSLVQTIDILPTVLHLMGLEYKEDFSGNSLVKMIQNPGDSSSHPVFLERRRYGPSSILHAMAPGNKFALRDGNMKYIWAPEEGTEELYNLAADPAELKNIVNRHRETADKMRDMIEEWKKGEADTKHEQSIDEETRKKLEALGYVE